MSLTKVTYSMIESSAFNVMDYGAVGDGSTDDTAAIALAFDAVKTAGGGDLCFPTGDYRFNLDVSGVNPRMQWIGQGSVTFRPYLADPDAPAIVWADNSGALGSALGVNIIFRNINFTGRFLNDVDPQYGRVSACVNLRASWATFYDCGFTYGINAGFASLYGQYNEFYSCSFGANVDNAGTAGCLLDSNTDAEAANENTFIRCKFNTNKNGLVIKGGLGNRIIGCQFQNTVAGGVAALVLEKDSTGFGTSQNWVSGNYFEINSRDVHIGVAPGSTFEGNIFLPGTVFSTHTYDVRFIGNTSYGGAATPEFNHPIANADIASLTWIGNNFEPDTSGMVHAGPTYLNIQGAQSRYVQNDNQLVTTNQTEANTGTTLVSGFQYGFKGNVARTVVTNLFKITQESFATLTARYSAFEVVLEAVNDEAMSTQFGYCSRLDKFHVFITNNTTGAPQVYISNLAGGVDTGINTAFAAIGQITLSATVSGDQITFKAVYSGAGSSPTSLATINVGYRINYTGGNPVTFSRF